MNVKAVAPRTNKSISPEEEIKAARIYHKKLRAILRCEPPLQPTDMETDDITRLTACPTFGRFRLHDRVNIDQVALRFANHNRRKVLGMYS